VLITAREIDQQYEWTAHELAGVGRAWSKRSLMSVKYDRDVASLSDKRRDADHFRARAVSRTPRQQ
jgi:hypothetical protein